MSLDIEKDMKKVINLAPGESTKFLFYTVYFCDLTKQETIPEWFNIETFVRNSYQICRSGGTTGGGLSTSYIKQALAVSRYLVIAADEENNIGAFVFGHIDDIDPRGIYVEASCNTVNATLEKKPKEYELKTAQFKEQVKVMSAEEIVDRLKTLGKEASVHQIKANPNIYRSVLAKRMLENLNLKPIEEKLNVRTAQLLKIALFKYANKIGIKHAYNSAASVSVAQFHARNGMLLRSANCDEPDEVAEEFSRVPYEDKPKYIEDAVKSGKFKADKTGSYPMKLCKYNIDVLFTEVVHHTATTVLRITSKGFTMEDINSINLSM